MGIAKGHKVVYGLWCFKTLTSKTYRFPAGAKMFHGVLFFSSLEKLEENCPWRTEEDIVAMDVIPEDTIIDFVPDNF